MSGYGTAPAAAAAPTVNVTPIVAPILIGHSFNWLGFGSLIVQCYIYYDNFPRDRPMIRTLVYGLLVLEILQTVTTSHQTYWYMVTNWNNPAALALFPWSAMTVPTVDGLIAFFVQAFYSWRIWTLAKSIYMKGMAVFIFFIATASAGVAIVTAAYFAAHSSRELLEQLHPAFTTWLATNVVSDVLVALCMSWILYTAKANTVWRDSDTMLTRLITNTIGTGAAVALCGLLTLILFVTSPEDSLQYLSGAYLLGKLYSNSVMVTLNARKPTRLQNASPDATSNASAAATYPMEVRVARQVHTMADRDAEIAKVSHTWSQHGAAGQQKSGMSPFYVERDISLSKLNEAQRDGESNSETNV